MPKAAKRTTKPMNDDDFESFLRNVLEQHGNIEPEEMGEALSGAKSICEELGLYADDAPETQAANG